MPHLAEASTGWHRRSDRQRENVLTGLRAQADAHLDRVMAVLGRLPAALVDLGNRLQERLIDPEPLPRDFSEDQHVRETVDSVLAQLRSLKQALEGMKIPEMLDHIAAKNKQS